MRRSAATFCLVLLLAPALTSAAVEAPPPATGSGGSGSGSSAAAAARAAARAKALGGGATKQATRVRRNSAAFCGKHVTGCTQCVEEAGAVASGAQFPDAADGAPQEAVAIVTCLNCSAAYTLKTDTGLCECGVGAATAFANGTLISPDVVLPATPPSTLSDVWPLPADNASGGSSSSSSTRAGANRSSSSGRRSGGGAPPSSAQAEALRRSSLRGAAASTRRASQLAARRSFQEFVERSGGSLRVEGGAVFLEAPPPSRRGARRSSPPGATARGGSGGSTRAGEAAEPPPAGVSEDAAPLICAACGEGTVSVGGLIGGSFCQPCPGGQTPDRLRASCEVAM